MNTIENKDILAWLKQHAPTARLVADSRKVGEGDVFFAIKTQLGDGRQFIAQAVERGASAIVFEAQGECEFEDLNILHLAVPHLAERIGELSHAWYGLADQNMLSIAVTGTNGKTSCTQWLAQALSMDGAASAVVGTLGIGLYRNGQVGELHETGLTTPDAISLHSALASLRDQGATALAIEASSIGLEQGRMSGLHVDVAMLTNLTRDHLDYHGDMANYAAAKLKLFEWASLQTAVINLDDAFGLQVVEYLCAHRPACRVLGYSLQQSISSTLVGVDVLMAQHIKTTHAGTSFHLVSPFGSGLVKTRLVGQFNVSNILGVMAVLLAQGMALDKLINIIEKLQPVPGRMQLLGNAGHVMVVVDYAHTPDALQQTLNSLRQVADERGGQLWCVFGCGGDRDPGKRPQMGKIAESADYAIVTSDNPRNEEPATIIEHIVTGMQRPAHVIEDRAAAILYAVKHAGEKDVVLLAGKGHENYQDIKGKKWPFSDAEHAALALATVATSGHTKRGG